VRACMCATCAYYLCFCKVDHNYMYMVQIYGTLGRKITKHSVIHGAYIRFWPTPFVYVYASTCVHVGLGVGKLKNTQAS